MLRLLIFVLLFMEVLCGGGTTTNGPGVFEVQNAWTLNFQGLEFRFSTGLEYEPVKYQIPAGIQIFKIGTGANVWINDPSIPAYDYCGWNCAGQDGAPAFADRTNIAPPTQADASVYSFFCDYACREALGHYGPYCYQRCDNIMDNYQDNTGTPIRHRDLFSSVPDFLEKTCSQQSFGGGQVQTYCQMLPNPPQPDQWQKVNHNPLSSMANQPMPPRYQIRWGLPGNHNLMSGFGWTPEENKVMPLAKDFKLGQLVHFNFPIWNPALRFSLVMPLRIWPDPTNCPVNVCGPDRLLASAQFNYDFDIDETPNPQLQASCFPGFAAWDAANPGNAIGFTQTPECRNAPAGSPQSPTGYVTDPYGDPDCVTIDPRTGQAGIPQGPYFERCPYPCCPYISSLSQPTWPSQGCTPIMNFPECPDLISVRSLTNPDVTFDLQISDPLYNNQHQTTLTMILRGFKAAGQTIAEPSFLSEEGGVTPVDVFGLITVACPDRCPDGGTPEWVPSLQACVCERCVACAEPLVLDPTCNCVCDCTVLGPNSIPVFDAGTNTCTCTCPAESCPPGKVPATNVTVTDPNDCNNIDCVCNCPPGSVAQDLGPNAGCTQCQCPQPCTGFTQQNPDCTCTACPHTADNNPCTPPQDQWNQATCECECPVCDCPNPPCDVPDARGNIPLRFWDTNPRDCSCRCDRAKLQQECDNLGRVMVTDNNRCDCADSICELAPANCTRNGPYWEVDNQACECQCNRARGAAECRAPNVWSPRDCTCLPCEQVNPALCQPLCDAQVTEQQCQALFKTRTFNSTHCGCYDCVSSFFNPPPSGLPTDPCVCANKTPDECSMENSAGNPPWSPANGDTSCFSVICQSADPCVCNTNCPCDFPKYFDNTACGCRACPAGDPDCLREVCLERLQMEVTCAALNRDVYFSESECRCGNCHESYVDGDRNPSTVDDACTCPPGGVTVQSCERDARAALVAGGFSTAQATQATLFVQVNATAGDCGACVCPPFSVPNAAGLTILYDLDSGCATVPGGSNPCPAGLDPAVRAAECERLHNRVFIVNDTYCDCDFGHTGPPPTQPPTQPGASPTPPNVWPPPPGRIGDFVWQDNNQNGVQDPGEPGIQGVTVLLLRQNGQLVDTTVTNLDGIYTFPEVDPGRYIVEFDLSTIPPGTSRVPANAGSDDALDSDVTDDTGRVTGIVLTPGEINETIDLGLLPAQPPGSIGDFVWDDLDKDGVQDPGEPGVPGVRVTLIEQDGTPVAETTTDANGIYNFPNVPPGTGYIVKFDTSTLPPGYTPTTPNTPDDNTDSDVVDPTGTVPGVDVQSGQPNLTVDFGVQSVPPGSIGDFVWEDTNGNGIQDPGEPGIPNVPVTLLDDEGTPIGTTTTDPNGIYNFPNVPPGTYTVRFDPPTGFTPTTPNTPDDTTDSDVVDGTGNVPNVVVESGVPNDTVDFGLVPGTQPGSIGDFVWHDTNMNGIQDTGEPGIEGVDVILLNPLTGSTVQTTTTIAGGLYLFDQVPPGIYTVKFDMTTVPSGPSGNTYTPTLPNASAGTEANDSDVSDPTGNVENVRVLPGQSNLDTDFGLVDSTVPGSIGDFVWEDNNKNGVQDPGEPGIPNVTVELIDPSGMVVQTTTTDPSGIYNFPNVPPGVYTVRFDTSTLPPGFVPTVPNTPNDATDSDVTDMSGNVPGVVVVPGQPNDTIDFGAQPSDEPGSIGDFVWDDLDNDGVQDPGEPGIPGVVVVLRDENGNIVDSTTTNPQGIYNFPNVPPGTYSITFDPDTFPINYEPTVPNTSDDTTDSDVVGPDGAVPGVVVRPGEPNNDVDFGLTATVFPPEPTPAIPTAAPGWPPLNPPTPAGIPGGCIDVQNCVTDKGCIGNFIVDPINGTNCYCPVSIRAACDENYTTYDPSTCSCSPCIDFDCQPPLRKSDSRPCTCVPCTDVHQCRELTCPDVRATCEAQNRVYNFTFLPGAPQCECGPCDWEWVAPLGDGTACDSCPLTAAICAQRSDQLVFNATECSCRCPDGGPVCNTYPNVIADTDTCSCLPCELGSTCEQFCPHFQDGGAFCRAQNRNVLFNANSCECTGECVPPGAFAPDANGNCFCVITNEYCASQPPAGNFKTANLTSCTCECDLDAFTCGPSATGECTRQNPLTCTCDVDPTITDCFCGDGIVQPGEDCDPGNDPSVSPCCRPGDCTWYPAGYSCSQDRCFRDGVCTALDATQSNSTALQCIQSEPICPELPCQTLTSQCTFDPANPGAPPSCDYTVNPDFAPCAGSGPTSNLCEFYCLAGRCEPRTVDCQAGLAAAAPAGVDVSSQACFSYECQPTTGTCDFQWYTNDELCNADVMQNPDNDPCSVGGSGVCRPNSVSGSPAVAECVKQPLCAELETDCMAYECVGRGAVGRCVQRPNQRLDAPCQSNSLCDVDPVCDGFGACIATERKQCNSTQCSTGRCLDFVTSKQAREGLVAGQCYEFTVISDYISCNNSDPCTDNDYCLDGECVAGRDNCSGGAALWPIGVTAGVVGLFAAIAAFFVWQNCQAANLADPVTWGEVQQTGFEKNPLFEDPTQMTENALYAQ